MTKPDIMEVKKAFEETLKDIPIFIEERQRARPRFPLEWDSTNQQYKYLVVDTMFRVFKNVYEQMEELKSKCSGCVVDVDSILLELTEVPVVEENPVIRVLKRKKFHTDSCGFVMLQPVTELHCDSWSGREYGRTRYFLSEDDAEMWCQWYYKKYHKAIQVPESYTLQELGKVLKRNIMKLEVVESCQSGVVYFLDV